MKLLTDHRGAAPILFLGIVFALLCLVLLIAELGGTYEQYDYAMDVMQRACNSAVERNIRDNYRADKILLLDCEGAKRDFQSFLSEDMPGRYQVQVASVTCTASPPSMTVLGQVSFSTFFSQFGFDVVSFNFKVRATNYDLD